MALAAGTRFGPYEILAPLGAGGMGEVYRARDMKLNRDVAIKILPLVFASNGDRLARFEREAQTLAALNDPHIAQIYGVLEQPPALLMEFVDGEDLARRLTRGALRVDDAVAIARQIAKALEAAHETGIVHRDLKPANVIVRPDGQVKVLDFGLAKVLSPEGPRTLTPTAVANSPTVGASLRPAVLDTEAGTLLGTAVYMSPEQARGRPVDKRTDIWAFGCVLYELLTARRAFDSDDVPSLITKIMRDEPDWTALPASTPASIRQLLRRCLMKDPLRRLRDIGEARVALSALDDSGEEPSQSDAPLHGRGRGPWPFLAAAGALGIVIGAVATWLVGGTRASAPLTAHFTFATDSAGGNSIPAVSPDGRNVALAGENGVWVRPLDGTTIRQVVSGVHARGTPFWSPDSRWIGFLGKNALLKVPTAGGAAVKVADLQSVSGPVSSVQGAGVWLADDTIVFTTGFTGLMGVPANGGDPAVLVPPASATEDFHGVTALPSGGFVTAVHAGAAVDTLIAWRDGKRSVVLQTKGQDLAGATYSATGHLLFQRLPFAGIWALPFDEKTLRRTGEPFLVLESAGNASVSADAQVFVAHATAPPSPAQVAVVARDGAVVQDVGPDGRLSLFDSPELSRDGRRVLIVSAQSGPLSAWVYPLDSRLPSQITDGIELTSAQWMPGERELIVVAGTTWCMSGDCFSIQSRSLDGSATATLAKGWSPDVSPDGKLLVYSRRTDAEWDLAVKPLDSSGEPKAFEGGPGWQVGARFSPDGHYIAYMSTENGRADVYVAAFPSGQKHRVTSTGGYWPRWSRDGRRLYYANDGRHAIRADAPPSGWAAGSARCARDHRLAPAACAVVRRPGRRVSGAEILQRSSDP